MQLDAIPRSGAEWSSRFSLASMVALTVALIVVFVQAPCAFLGHRALSQKRYRRLTLVVAIDAGGSFAVGYVASKLIL